MYSSILLLLLLPTGSISTMESFTPRGLLQSQPLPLPLLAGYQPLSSVVLANIDLDHAEMGQHLTRATDESFAKAKRIYQEGANAKPYAILTLLKPLELDLKDGWNVAGETPKGSTVTGTILGEYPAGATQIAVIYNGSTQDCSVGASSYPEVQGCLKPAGSVFLQDVRDEALPYTYNPVEDNQNRMSLQKLSTHAKQKMYACDDCPFPLYSQFVNYYGSFSYADHWIQTAFDGSNTALDNGNGNFEFYGYEARKDIIQKATVYMNLWMAIQNELNTAIVQCQEGCLEESCNEDSIHSWDLSVAFYAGSLEGTHTLGSGNGRLLHKLADKRCVSFHTCDGYHGLSSVNDEMFQLFLAGQHRIQRGKCSVAKDIMKRISSLMIVPLLQEALWHAHITDTKPEELLKEPEDADKISAGTATVAAAILPLIHSCDPLAANVVLENLKTGHDANFAHVKAALESTYECMGITCEDVGGLYHGGKKMYVKGAEPCGYTGPVDSSSITDGLSDLDICLIVLCTLLGAIALFGLCYWLSGYTITKKDDGTEKSPPIKASENENDTSNHEGPLKVEEGDFA